LKILNRHIVIGDIHGCIVELELLLQKLVLHPNDTLYFIGDLIDKGPNSLAVVQRAYQLSLKYNVILILGNHEEKFLRYLQHKQTNSKALATMKITPDFELLAQNLKIEEIDFLKQSFYTYYLEPLNLILVHGGITKNCKVDFKINSPYNSEKRNSELELLTKTRFLDSNGKFVSLGSENETTPFWADVYDGSHGKVVFGHHSFIQNSPSYFPNAIGIDNGCVYGGYLTALIFTDKKITFTTTKANTIYSTNYV
jgi:serine/threonine protein phosphatase 1